MKYTAAAVALLAGAASAAPTTLQARNATAAGASSPSFIFPNILSIHSVNTNDNTLSTQTSTVRNGNTETTTLYQLPIPAAAAGKTCSLVIFSSAADASVDTISGTGALDIFNNNIPNSDLADAATGNFRNNLLARVVFNPATGLFDFDTADVTPKIQSFPCPAGKTLEWESVSVGTADEVVLEQGFAVSGSSVPNGLTISFQ